MKFGGQTVKENNASFVFEMSKLIWKILRRERWHTGRVRNIELEVAWNDDPRVAVENDALRAHALQEAHPLDHVDQRQAFGDLENVEKSNHDKIK